MERIVPVPECEVVYTGRGICGPEDFTGRSI